MALPLQLNRTQKIPLCFFGGLNTGQHPCQGISLQGIVDHWLRTGECQADAALYWSAVVHCSELLRVVCNLLDFDKHKGCWVWKDGCWEGLPAQQGLCFERDDQPEV